MAEIRDNEKIYQFCSENGYPVFIKFNPEDFDDHLTDILSELHCSDVTDKGSKWVKNELKKRNARLLSLKTANHHLSSMIQESGEMDFLGTESINPSKKGYYIYRYKGMAVILYSYAVVEWDLAGFFNFGHTDHRFIYQIILTRYLSLALAPFGVVGFWGQKIQEGLVVMKQNESFGKTFFIDWLKRTVMADGHIVPITSILEFIRLDQGHKKRKSFMNREELVTFLSLNCTYFSFQGLSFSVRQVILALGKTCKGLYYSYDDLHDPTGLAVFNESQ